MHSERAANPETTKCSVKRPSGKGIHVITSGVDAEFFKTGFERGKYTAGEPTEKISNKVWLELIALAELNQVPNP